MLSRRFSRTAWYFAEDYASTSACTVVRSRTINFVRWSVTSLSPEANAQMTILNLNKSDRHAGRHHRDYGGIAFVSNAIRSKLLII